MPILGSECVEVPCSVTHAKRMARRALVAKLGRPLRPGLITRHLCGNAICRNPDHVVEGTHAENNKDTHVHGHKVPLKLPRYIRREIAARYKFGGISQQKLADEYGVIQCRVSQIVRGWCV